MSNVSLLPTCENGPKQLTNHSLDIASVLRTLDDSQQEVSHGDLGSGNGKDEKDCSYERPEADLVVVRS